MNPLPESRRIQYVSTKMTRSYVRRAKSKPDFLKWSRWWLRRRTRANMNSIFKTITWTPTLFTRMSQTRSSDWSDLIWSSSTDTVFSLSHNIISVGKSLRNWESFGPEMMQRGCNQIFRKCFFFFNWAPLKQCFYFY